MNNRTDTLKQIDMIIEQFTDALGRLDEGARDVIADIANILIEAFEQGRSVYICGNGGSAADAQHIAAEMVGRFQRDGRKALPCVAMTTDTSIITAVGNDFGFEDVFARQVEALGKPGDVLWVLSTSGKSPNIVKAANIAHERGMKIVAMTGGDGGRLSNLADVCFIAPADRTYLIQQIHQLAYHIICELVDKHFASNV
ncbi:MAG: D-sedoheptulose 7-phosphate isomerase [Planctomycetes bacterium]|nr:D-sedoheptulose 7-phosphate isomerase [Planctomycetota bacterium]